MKSTLANPTVDSPTTAHLLGMKWTTRRRVATGTGTGSAGTDQDGTGSADDQDDDDDGDDSTDDTIVTDDGAVVSKADHDAVVKRMQAADRAKAQAEAKLKELADKDKGELEKATEKVTELTATNAKLTEQINALQLENAFANVTGINWRKPGAALKLARAEGYLDEVTKEDGTVDSTAFSKKVKEFAKAYPEMTQETGSSNGNSGNGSGSSGGGVGSGGRRSSTTTDDDKIKAKYGKFLR